jgi:hypothetical protein
MNQGLPEYKKLRLSTGIICNSELHISSQFEMKYLAIHPDYSLP